jgi:hypothetical protein
MTCEPAGKRDRVGDARATREAVEPRPPHRPGDVDDKRRAASRRGRMRGRRDVQRRCDRRGSPAMQQPRPTRDDEHADHDEGDEQAPLRERE